MAFTIAIVPYGDSTKRIIDVRHYNSHLSALEFVNPARKKIFRLADFINFVFLRFLPAHLQA